MSLSDEESYHQGTASMLRAQLRRECLEHEGRVRLAVLEQAEPDAGEVVDAGRQGGRAHVLGLAGGIEDRLPVGHGGTVPSTKAPPSGTADKSISL
jgi:hypothetical protein